MAAYINELMFDPFLESNNRGQYVELRGEPGATIDDGTYLLVISDDNRGVEDAGTVTGIFDLSGLEWGDNGILVLMQQDSLHKLGAGLKEGEPGPNILRSTAPGFSGLPGNIFKSTFTTNTELSFIASSISVFLVQSDVAPKLNDDIDRNDDGKIDVDGPAKDWNVYDSVSLHDDIFRGSVAYGQVAFIQRFIDSEPFVATPEGTNVIYTEGFGYVARIGDSTGHTAKDWVGGTVRAPELNAKSDYFRFENGSFGVPEPYALTGRELDHIGESNFFGGVRGKVTETTLSSTGSDVTKPVAGVRFLADTNNNGRRDVLSYQYDPDSFAVDAEMTNAFPGVTITTVNSSGDPVGYDVQAKMENTTSTGNKVFGPLVFNFATSNFRLRFDFANPVRSVSIDTIGQYNSIAAVGYLEAFNAAGESLGFAFSRSLLGAGLQQTLRLSFSSDVIAYALAYTPSSSPSFAMFDDLKFTQSEAVAETNEQGEFTFGRLLPDEYQIVPFANSEVALAEPIPVTPIEIKRYENFRLNFDTELNTPPEIKPAKFTVAEDAAVDTPVGKVEGSDLNSDQTITYSIEDAANSPVRINAESGELFIAKPEKLDFETNPTIIVKVIATDSIGGSGMTEIELNLTDVNEAPVVEDATFEVSEEAIQGAAIGRVTAFDPEKPDQAPHFEIVGGTGSDEFEIGESSGVITVKKSGGIDFEAMNFVTLNVAVSDRSTPPLTRMTTVTVGLVNANDPPLITTDKIEVLESLEVGQSVGFVEADDEDGTQTFFFRIMEATNVFRIDELTGELFLTAPLNYESRSRYELKIQVVDNGVPPRPA